MSELEEGERPALKADVGDVKKPVVGNSSQEMKALLPGATEENPILISDKEEGTDKETCEEEHPGKRIKTEEPGNKENIDYHLNPKPLHIANLNDAEEKEISVSGLTMLHKELFVIFEKKSEVKVFHALTFSRERSFTVLELDSPLDIVSSPFNNCLYISSPNHIYIVDRKGTVILKWPIEDGGGTLSVSDDQTVVLSVWKRTALKEYSANGQMCLEVRLPSDVHLFHAVKISIDRFVVSFERRMMHSVCTVDRSGNIIQSFSGMLKFPKYLAVTSKGYIIVADEKNSRLLMMSPTLQSSKVLLSDEAEVGRPSRICLDEANNRMFVADIKTKAHRFMIFELHKHITGTTEDNPVVSSDTSGIEEGEEEFQDAKETIEESPVDEVRPGKRKREE